MTKQSLVLFIHVYGLSSVLNAAPVDLILTPVLKWDSKAFDSMLKYAEMQGIVKSLSKKEAAFTQAIHQEFITSGKGLTIGCK